MMWTQAVEERMTLYHITNVHLLGSRHCILVD